VRLVTPALLAATLLTLCSTAQAALIQDVPPPQPFPRPGSRTPPPSPAPSVPTPAAPAPTPAAPAPAASAPTAPSDQPTDESLGFPGIIYPTAEFLDAYDVGGDQRSYLFGTNLSHTEMIAYYRTILRDGGRELFRAPAMRQFDLGRFDDRTMAAQPSVVVKDYSFGNSEGYLHVDGTESRRFKTIIQIVPPPGR
jgi:hypothetical protein